MIDWLTFTAPCTHLEPITGDRILRITPDGEILWESIKRLEIRGSYESAIYVKTKEIHPDGSGAILSIDGNPSKFFQGHNLWGSDDLPALVLALLEAVATRLDLTPTPFERLQWQAGAIELTRVDVTGMWELYSRADVRAWIRAAEFMSKTRHGRPSMKGGTLYWGKNSRRWTIKAYGKGDELDAGKAHGLPQDLPMSTYVQQWADNKLRLELTVRGMELKKIGLSLAVNWAYHTPMELLQERLGRIDMAEQVTLPGEVLEGLSPRIQLAYRSWVRGEDLRAILPRMTFYRYRSELLVHGIDIAIRQPHEDRSNVVPLVRVLEAKPAAIPEWAYGTSLYFEPRKHG